MSVNLSAMAALDGKRAIVTGASSGIGAATARALEEAGARVYIGSRRDGNLDVTDPESSRALRRAALAELGGLDILFNNAGLSLGRDPVWESSEEDEREVIETNVLGLMRMTRLCLPCARRGRGRPHRQHGLGRRHLVVRERLVVRRLEVRRARLHACAARRPAGQAGARSRTSPPASSRRTSPKVRFRATRRGQGRLLERRDGRPDDAPRTSPTACCSR